MRTKWLPRQRNLNSLFYEINKRMRWPCVESLSAKQVFLKPIQNPGTVFRDVKALTPDTERVSESDVVSCLVIIRIWSQAGKTRCNISMKYDAKKPSVCCVAWELIEFTRESWQFYPYRALGLYFKKGGCWESKRRSILPDRHCCIMVVGLQVKYLYIDNGCLQSQHKYTITYSKHLINLIKYVSFNICLPSFWRCLYVNVCVWKRNQSICRNR